MVKKYFFGWSNIKKLITELLKVLSGKGSSFFSKKRIESTIAFIIGEIGMITYLVSKLEVMDMMDLGLWATIQFGLAGYIVNHIEKNKKSNNGEVVKEISDK